MGAMVLRNLRRLTSDFRRDRRANVVMIFAFLLIPVLFAAGMGVDYATAARRRAKLDAAADSAALAAVTPSSMALSSTNAQTLAQTLFNTLSSQVMGLQSGISEFHDHRDGQWPEPDGHGQLSPPVR